MNMRMDCISFFCLLCCRCQFASEEFHAHGDVCLKVDACFCCVRVQASVEVKYSPGDVIAVANGHPNHRVFMVKSGEVTLVSPDVHIPGEGL
eukprot:1159457-Pelagomonas_calceolata.AAC.1